MIIKALFNPFLTSNKNGILCMRTFRSLEMETIYVNKKEERRKTKM